MNKEISAEHVNHYQSLQTLNFLILNLMPNKKQTDIQLLRLITKYPGKISVNFINLNTCLHKNMDDVYVQKYYQTFYDIKNNFYDVMIITGAPVEIIPFEEVDYWRELTEIFDWSNLNVKSILHICWGAQAALYHHFGVKKIKYKEKLFGIYSQIIEKRSPLLKDFNDIFDTPQSRYTGIDESTVNLNLLNIIAKNSKIGATILESKDRKKIFVFGHLEYDTLSLHKEYIRDINKGLQTKIPHNYYTDDNLKQAVLNTWRSPATLFFRNWISDAELSKQVHLNCLNDSKK